MWVGQRDKIFVRCDCCKAAEVVMLRREFTDEEWQGFEPEKAVWEKAEKLRWTGWPMDSRCGNCPPWTPSGQYH